MATETNTDDIDLTSCDKEPIQFCGAIMPHGVLMVIQPNNYTILAISTNAVEEFDIASSHSLAHISTLFKTDCYDKINTLLTKIADKQSSPPSYLGRYQVGKSQKLYDIFAHRSNQYIVIEFLILNTNDDVDLHELVRIKPNETEAALQSSANWQEAIAITTAELKQITEFNTVLGIRVLDDGSSQVIAESRDGVFPPFIDKRFPRSDIPQPGRSQMTLMPMMYTPAMNYEPLPITNTHIAFDPAQLDLTYALLRSTSPMCRKFYLNVGVHARAVFSILDQGKLWGFFVCWHAKPKSLGILQRTMSQSFAGLAGQFILEKARSQRNQEALDTKLMTSYLAINLAKDLTNHAWFDLAQSIVNNLDVSGVIILVDDEQINIGKTLPENSLKKLLIWLNQQDDFYFTDSYSDINEEHSNQFADARGIIAMRLMGGERKHYFIKTGVGP